MKKMPWSTRRFFAENAAKMENINAKRKKLKVMKDQKAPLNTMEALKNALDTQESNTNTSEESN